MECTLVNSFFNIVDKIVCEQKTSRDYGTGHQLYHSEVNLIEEIYNHPEINGSVLAEKLDITKGAVTQVANKLMLKGLIETYSSISNKKVKYYKLTELGEQVHKGHLQYHEEANQKLCEYFCSLNEHDVEVIFGFLNKMEEYMPICEFLCKHHGGTPENHKIN